MVRKRSVPAWVYYAVAVCCSLATIPMYRYMLAHAGDDYRPQQHVMSHPPIAGPQAVAALPSSSTVLAPLAANELCEAGYLIIRNGNSYRQALGVDGRPARCVPGYTFAHVPRPGDMCMDPGVLLEQVSPGHMIVTDVRCVRSGVPPR